MRKSIIILNDIKSIPFGTQVRIRLNKIATMEAVSFGSKFGLQNGEFKTAEEIEENGWQIVLGWR